MLDFGKQKQQPRDRLLLITGQIAEFFTVQEDTAEYVRAGDGEYPRAQLRECITPAGGRLFVAHADLGARLQAEEVRQLRRNAILGSLFQQPGPDMNRVPLQLWILLGGLVVFLGIAAAR